MKTTMKYILAGGAAALFATSMAASAEAYYLGYANGDPANWGFYEEQHNGASPPTPAAEPPAYSYVGRHPARIEYHGRMYLRHDVRRAPSGY
jgi:hypothetical protein